MKFDYPQRVFRCAANGKLQNIWQRESGRWVTVNKGFTVGKEVKLVIGAVQLQVQVGGCCIPISRDWSKHVIYSFTRTKNCWILKRGVNVAILYAMVQDMSVVSVCIDGLLTLNNTGISSNRKWRMFSTKQNQISTSFSNHNGGVDRWD